MTLLKMKLWGCGTNPPAWGKQALGFTKREFFIDNLLVQMHSILMMNRWTGLAPWEFEFPFQGSLAPMQRLSVTFRTFCGA